MLAELRAKRAEYRKYGVVSPDRVYDSVYNPATDTNEEIPVKDLVDKVRKRVSELRSHRERVNDDSLYNYACRRLELAEKQRQIEKCRKTNLLIKEFKRFGIKVRVRE